MKIDMKWAVSNERALMCQLLSHMSDGVIVVEPDGHIFWANDAALALFEVRRFADLGGTANGFRKRFELYYRNNRRVPAKSYPLGRIIGGDAFRDQLFEIANARGDSDRSVLRMQGLILTGLDDKPDCMALVITDVTEWANAEQRFEKTFNANPAPALIIRLADRRYIKINQGFVEMTGYTRDEILGRHLRDLDVLEGVTHRQLARERLRNGTTIPQVQSCLQRPDGSTMAVIVAGQPIEIGDDACMLFTFMDIDQRQKAEQALRESEERFTKAFRVTPVPSFAIGEGDGGVIAANQALSEATGYSEKEMLGKTLVDIGLFAKGPVGDDITHALDEHGNLSSTETQVTRKNGDDIACLVSVETTSLQGRACHLLRLQDISERKRSEMDLIAAIDAVMKDASWFSRTLIERLANVRHAGGSADAKRAQLADLSQREKDVLAHICEGRSDKEIASELDLATNTVRNHVAKLYSKLDLHKRGEVVIWARERGFAGL